MSTLRLVVAGSPAAAVPTLETLADGPHEVSAVITRPAAPLGRRRVMTRTPVSLAAEARGITVLEARALGAIERDLSGMTVDLGVIVAYGALVRPPLLSWPRLGWINLHFSLLPRWRGAAPVQRAIMAGDSETGATVFQLTEGLDEGAWYAQLSTAIGAHRTAGSLLDELSVSGAELVARVVDDLAAGTAVARAQQGDVTFAPKLTRADAALAWSSPAEVVHAHLRGVTPEPGAHTLFRGESLKILEATIAREDRPLTAGDVRVVDGVVYVGTATVPLELIRVQPAGRQAMSAADWMRGLPAGDPVQLTS